MGAVASTAPTQPPPSRSGIVFIADPTLADATLDRLVHCAYKFALKGESMRKRHRPLTDAAHSGA